METYRFSAQGYYGHEPRGTGGAHKNYLSIGEAK
jgi:hypothetical protein